VADIYHTRRVHRTDRHGVAAALTPAIGLGVIGVLSAAVWVWALSLIF
jgi:hypothetical protein